MKFIWSIIHYLIPTTALRSTMTVRFAFPLLFAFATFLGLASIVSTSASAIELELKTTVVNKNSDFQIDVYATALVPVNAVNIAIDYSADLIEVLGIDKGQSVITLWTEDPKATNGVITLTGGTYRKGFIGKHLIATINARAKVDGKANFVVKKAELYAGDGKASAVLTKLDNGRADIMVTSQPVQSNSGIADQKSISVYVVTDIDHDGAVSMADITTFMKNWFTRSALYDFNNDGLMTINDLSILLSAYVKS
jgi:hypothetical protein